jgi:hypothetical protein
MSDAAGPSGAIYVDVTEFQRASRKCRDLRAVYVVTWLLAYGNNQAFGWDPDEIAALLTAESAEPITGADLRKMTRCLARFFIAVRPGIWAPNPKIFSWVDGNPGSQS